MEDSYKKIRAEKEQKKKQQAEVVIEVTDNKDEKNIEVDSKKTTSTAKKKTSNTKGRK